MTQATKTNKFDIGKSLVNKTEVSFTTPTDEEKKPLDKKQTKPQLPAEKQKNIKVNVYFTSTEMSILKEALFINSQKSNSLPKMGTFLHDIVMQEIGDIVKELNKK